MKGLFTFIVSFFVITLSAQSAEVDHFTGRHDPLSDSSAKINYLANKKIRTALLDLKKSKKGCSEDALYSVLRKIFANHRNGELTMTIIDNDSIEKRITTFDQSVFGQWSAWDGLVLGSSFFKKSGLAISPLVRIGDHIVGADKFEHLFGRGFQYFTNYYLKKKNIADAVKRGVFDEKLIFGGNKLATGVFSYADLSANFNGMRFWNHMLQLREDVLEQNLGPYITCENNVYVQVKEIDFRDYMDESMDEAINCSKFPTEKTLKRYMSEVEKRGFTCPVDPEINREMIKKYKRFSLWIINRGGNMTIDYKGEFEE